MGMGQGPVVATARALITATDETGPAYESASRTFDEAVLKQHKTLTKLQEVQQQATRAQKAYTKAVAEHGIGSREAMIADERLSRAERQVGLEARAAGNHFQLFGRHVSGASGELGKAERGILSGSGAFSHLGRSIAFASGAFLGAAGFTAVVRHAINAAEELQTQLLRTDQVFGQNAGAIRAWSESTVKTLHLASGEALTLANNTGAFLKAMGVAPSVAAPWTEQLVKLGNQLARLKGIDPAEAMKAINQGLVGRGRALFALGIHIDAAAIKERALQDGLVKSVPVTEKVKLAEDALAVARVKAADALAKYGDGTTQVLTANDRVTKATLALTKAQAGVALPLTASQKAFVAYQLIMEQAGATSKSYEKWTHSLAGQQVALKADVKQLEEGIGKALIPTLTKVVTHLTDWLGKTKNQQTVQHDFKEILHAMVGTVTFLYKAFKALTDALGGTKDAVILLVTAFAGFKALKLVEYLIGVAAKIGLVGGAATAAETEVVALRLGLLSLGGPLVLAALAATLLALDEISHHTKGHTQTGGSAKLNTEVFEQGGKYYERVTVGRNVVTKEITKAQATAALGGGASNAGHPGAGDRSNHPGAQGAGAGPSWKPPAVTGSGIVATAESRIGQPYHYGGNSWDVGMDCSSFVQQVLARNGIAVPRTSQAQAAGGMAVSAADLMVGDLVFTDGWPHPGHVGLYIGGGMVIQDPHTGASVGTIPLSAFGMTGARRYFKTGTKTSVSGTSGLHTGHAAPKPPKGLTQAGLTTIRGSTDAFLKAAHTAAGTAGFDSVERDAAKHIRALEASLTLKMPPEALAKTRVELAKWKTVLKDEIKKNAKEARDAAKAGAAAWAIGFTEDTRLIGRAITDAWNAQTKKFDRETSDHLKALSDAVAKEQKAFDRATATGLQGFVVAQTPEEKALTDFQAARQAKADAAADTQRQKDLADAILGANPVAIAAAQDAIDQAAADAKEKGLQAAADASRVAQDKKTADQQQAYQDDRDAQWAAIQKKADDVAQGYQDERDALAVHNQEMHDDWQIHFDADLAQWKIWLSKKQVTWKQFLDFLNGQGVGVVLDKPSTTLAGAPSPPMPAAAAAAAQAAGRLPGQVQGFAGGGIVGGAFTGAYDQVRALLTPGEGVLTRDQMQTLAARLRSPQPIGGPGGHGGAVTVLAQFPHASVREAHLFSKSLEFELRALA